MMALKNFECYSTTTVILFLGIDFVWCILTVVIGSYQIVLLWCQVELNKFDNRLKWLSTTAQLFCLFAQFGLVFFVYSLLQICPYDGSLSPQATIGAAIGVICYSFMLTSLYCLFALRTHVAFVGSIYTLSRKTSKSLVVMSIILISMNIIAVTIFVVDLDTGLKFMGITYVKLYIGT